MKRQTCHLDHVLDDLCFAPFRNINLYINTFVMLERSCHRHLHNFARHIALLQFTKNSIKWAIMGFFKKLFYVNYRKRNVRVLVI